MKTSPYPAYKNSQVDWLGNVPEHWNVLKLKTQCSIYGRIGFRGYTTSDIVAEGEGALTLNPSNILEGKIDLAKCTYLRWEKYYESPEIQVKAKDVLLVKTGSTFGKVGQIKECHEPMTINPQMALLKDAKCNSRYLYFLISSKYIQSLISSRNTGSGMPTITQETIGNFPLPMPRLGEQAKIVAFLDRETAKIDLLIEKQQRLIKLLEEKRQAVISHAVTKGLNPDALMKDSGVEWLGEVPEHWEVKRVKHFGRVTCGFAFDSSDFTSDGVKTIKIANVSHLKFDWSDTSYLPEEYAHRYRQYIAPKDSLIFALTRPIISGGVKVAKLDKGGYLVNQRVGFIEPSSAINQDFLMYVAQSKPFFCAFANNITATNQPNISPEGIETIQIACPNLDEQIMIVNYIKRQLRKFFMLSSKAKQGIDLLKERRTALISAAVTGKIDVRDQVPQDVEEAVAS